MAAPLHRQTTCRCRCKCVVLMASTLPPQCHSPWSSRKLARSVRVAWRLRCKGKHQFCRCRCKCVVLTASTLPPQCQRQRRARTVWFHPPRTVEQPQACTISRSCMAASLQRQTTCRMVQVRGPGAKHSPVGVSAAETSTHTLSPPPLDTVEQPQACSTNRSYMAASLQRQTTCRCRCKCVVLAASTLPPECQRQRRA